MANTLLPSAPQIRPRRGLAALLVASSLLGGGAASAVFVATGATDGTASTTGTPVPTVTQQASGSGSTLSASSVYEHTSAGVVSISATGVSSNTSATPFGPPADSQQTASGSGFVVDGDGHVVTASHVVDGASKITVEFQDGTTRTAKLLGQDDATDVAVLSVDTSGVDVQPLQLGDSSSLQVGDAVAVIGDPFGYERSLSTGVVSGLGRTIEAPNGYTVAHAIQTDAALNPGNSGGPVVNADGEVIGIADQIATDGSSEDSAGVGFAVPIDLVKSELDALEAGEQVSHAYLGVGTSSAGTGDPGASIKSVASDSPASDAGLRVGDVITALGSTPVKDSDDLIAAIAALQPGDHVAVAVKRGSDSDKIGVTLGTQPSSASSS